MSGQLHALSGVAALSSTEAIGGTAGISGTTAISGEDAAALTQDSHTTEIDIAGSLQR